MSIFLNRLRIIKVLSVLQSLTKNVKHKHVSNKKIRIIQIKIFLSTITSDYKTFISDCMLSEFKNSVDSIIANFY